jgi:hypothetical protein
MKGIIFNLAEDVISERFGEDAWDDLLDAAHLDGAYTALGNYPDDEMVRLVAAGASRLAVGEFDVLRLLGEGAFPRLAASYPVFVAPHRSTRAFLLTLNDVIHSEVRKLYPDADVPDFGFSEPNADELVLSYESPRRLCALAEGFILGAAHHFRERVDIDQPECMLTGADRCLLRCRFSPVDHAA